MDARVTIGASELTVDGLDAVGRLRAGVQIDADVRQRVEQSYAFIQKLAQTHTPVYGLTTGCGPLASQPIPADRREDFQRNLVRSHATTLGAPHPTSFVRAAMALRAHVFALGNSGVAPATVDVLLAMLNAGIHPIVREIGGVGASGDLVELAQVALAVMGEGAVEVEGRVQPAAGALHAAEIAPLVPRYREGLALINGTSFHTGAAALLIAQARRVTTAAQIAAALGLEALRGNIEAYDQALHAARPHAGQRAVAAYIERLVDGSNLVRRESFSASTQDAYTLRCVPQVVGPVVDALTAVRSVVEIEINAAIDNPLFLAAEGRVVHGGNFHGQPVAMALDQLKTAMVELGVISERRVARLLDAKLNGGLPPFLIRDGAGLRSGLMGLQYCTSAMAADNAVLVTPTSVQSVPTNANNQDVVSMGMVAARHARQVIDNVERMVAIELLCAVQALDVRGSAHAGSGTRAAHAAIRDRVAPLIEDRPLAEDVETTCRLIDDETLVRAVDAAAT